MLYTLARLLELEQASKPLWREIVDHFAAVHRGDPRPYYLQARPLLEARQTADAVPLLKQALVTAPENLALLADLLVTAAAAGDGETTIDALRPAAHVVRNLLRPTELYRLHLVPLIGSPQAGGGLFPQHDFDPPLPKSIQGGQDIAINFEEAADFTIDMPPLTSWALISRKPGQEALLGAAGDGGFHLRPIGPRPKNLDLMISCDIDQDGTLDLVSAGSGHGVILHSGRADGTLTSPYTVLGSAKDERYTGLFPLDIDHEGDLDLLVTREDATDLYLQNNGDGTWTEAAEELGIAGPSATTTDLAVADFDDDGDLCAAEVFPSAWPFDLTLWKSLI